MEIISWKGICIVHDQFNEQEIHDIRKNNPGIKIIAHPECEEELLNHADFIGSTTALIKRTETSEAKDFIVVTEPGVIHQMEKLNPQKNYIPLANTEGCACNECPYMRLNKHL